MLTAPFTVLSIKCPLVVYVNSPTGGYIVFKTVRGAVNINY
jgi:hypothetical protein